HHKCRRAGCVRGTLCVRVLRMTSGSGKVRLDQRERVAVITPLGDVDLHNLAEVVAVFAQVLSDTSTDATLLDLSEVTFADSTFLNQLIQTLSDHTSIARPLVLTGPLQSAVRRLLEITGTDTFLPLADTAHEGLQQLRAVDTSATRGQTPAAGI
ncbi:STAS domain-containing protein, partial [Streptomyces sp. NPDC057284]|uniref:STAS domain-containing protein n=1 Tax=Streptomyces sp. NPDC057284 TaxID=3346083 RepID=UPI00363E966E